MLVPPMVVLLLLIVGFAVEEGEGAEEVKEPGGLGIEEEEVFRLVE